jgi:ADP-ribose pyrophosphatase YjhB (NUDIX family)
MRELYGAVRPQCPACQWIFFEDPKVAAGILVEQDGQVLLVRRVSEPHRGQWTLPAGFVNAREDPARAAERECLEETGLVVEVTGLHKLIAGREHPAGADIVLIYRAKVVGGTLAAADDADEAAFFPRSALPPLGFRATQEALQEP